MKYLLIAILSLFSADLFCQISQIDKLINDAQIANTNANSTIEEYIIWQQILNQLDLENSEYRKDEVHLGLAKFFYKSELYPEAIQYYIQSEAYIHTLPSLEKSVVFQELGDSYYKSEDKLQAKLYWEKALSHSEYPQNLDMLNHMIGTCQHINDYDRSIHYLLQQKQLLESNNGSVTMKSTVINNLAYAYHQSNNTTQAIDYFNKALTLDDDLTEKQKLDIYQNIGITHINQGDTDRGRDILLSIIQQTTNPQQIVEIAQVLGKLNAEKQNYLEALTYYKQAEANIQHEFKSDILAETYFGLSNVYNNINEYDLAFDYLKKYKEIIDENKRLLELENTRLLNQRREIERAEKQNQLFRATQKIQQAEINKLQTEAKNQELVTQSLKQDSVYRVSQLNIALQEKEIATANNKNAELELIRLNNISRLTQQELSIAKANQEKIELEKINQEKEIALAKEKLSVQERDAKIKEEQALNKLNQQELELNALEISQRKRSQRNILYLSGLLGLLALLTIGAYVIKKRDNQKLEVAYNDLSVSESKLKTAETKITNLLKQQVSGPIAAALIDDTAIENIKQKFVAILFLDIRGYSKFCETKTPAEIIAYQNQVFGFMINIIEKHNGVVNQLLGDGFMATFGAPVSVGNDSLNAYLAANEIKEVLQQKNTNKDIYPTEIGIGIHAGNVVAGNVGNEERKQYSISGNTVILAARLEQLNKENNSTLIYSKDLYDQLPKEHKSNIDFKQVMVKGRKTPIEIAVVD